MLAAACLQLITRLLVSKTNKVMKLSVFISSRSQFLISYVRIYLLLTSSQLRYFLCRISINHKSHPMSQLHYYNCSHVQTSKDRWRPICLPSHLSSSNDFGGCRLSARVISGLEEQKETVWRFLIWETTSIAGHNDNCNLAIKWRAFIKPFGAVGIVNQRKSFSSRHGRLMS